MKFVELNKCDINTTSISCPNCGQLLFEVVPKIKHDDIDKFFICPNDNCNFIGSPDCSICKPFKHMLAQNNIKIIDFQTSIRYGAAPLNVKFTETCINIDIPSNWNWDFGDGITTISSVNNISHIYQTPGIYNVTLTVFENAIGNHIVTKNKLIIVY